jgi:hypothetical protein
MRISIFISAGRTCVKLRLSIRIQRMDLGAEPGNKLVESDQYARIRTRLLNASPDVIIRNLVNGPTLLRSQRLTTFSAVERAGL